MSCPSCGGEIVEDCSQMLTQFVCCKCGSVITTSGQFQSADFNIGNIASANPSSNRVFNFNNKTRGFSETFKLGLLEIDNLTTHCNIPPYIKEEAITFFKNAHELDDFRNLRTKQKRLLAAGCFYITARRYNVMVTISHVSNITAISDSKISKVYKSLKKQFLIDIVAPAPEEMIESFMGNMLEAKELNTKEMRRRMEDITQLSQNCLLTTGIHFQKLLIAVLYVSWGSLVVRKQKTMSLTRFAKVHNIFHLINNAAHVRVKELLQMLCDLANNIPSLKDSKINNKTIFWYVETILQFQNLSMKRWQQDEGEQDLKTYTFQRKPGKRKVEEESDDGKDKKKSMASHDLNDPNLTDKDIPEDEIHKYLKTKDEVKYLNTILEKQSTIRTISTQNYS